MPMRRMTVGTTDVVPPVFTSSKVVVFFFSCVAGQAGFGYFLCGFRLEGDHFGGITFFNVGLTRSMTRLTACNFLFPATDLGEF